MLLVVDSSALSRPRGPLVDVISTAHVMVEEIEAWLNNEADEDPRVKLLKRLRRRTEEGLHARATLRVVLDLPAPSRADLHKTIAGLPVYPAVTLKMLRHAGDEEADFRALFEIALQDQTLAGRIPIRAANSAVWGSVSRISSIAHAISYIGLRETRRILTAAAIRPLFASANTAELWHHSLEVARWCESAGKARGEEFLAGLMHDVGRLLMAISSGDANVTAARLVGEGMRSAAGRGASVRMRSRPSRRGCAAAMEFREPHNRCGGVAPSQRAGPIRGWRPCCSRLSRNSKRLARRRRADLGCLTELKLRAG